MKERSSILTFCLTLICSGGALAQVAIDRSVELTSTAPAEQRVHGLADAVNEGDALNARSEQRNSHRFAVAQGVDQLTASLDPAPGALTAGTTIQIRFSNDNTGSVQLSLNGGSNAPVIKEGALQLQPGDLEAGGIGTLIYDGNSWHLLASRADKRRDCPAGFVAVTDAYCIETMQHDTVDFVDASLICGDLGGRLCTWGEWYIACANSTALGIPDMLGDWEWTNNTANADLSVRVVGASSCTQGSTGPAVQGPLRNVHCCFSR